MITEKQIRTAANELTEVLGIKPAIDSTLPLEALKPLIVEATTIIEKGDKFSKTTTAVIEESKKWEIVKAAEAESVAEAEAEDNNDPNENEDNLDVLKEEIESAATLKDLKAVAMGHDVEFGEMKLASYKTLEALKSAMLVLLESTQEEVPEPEQVKPAATVKPATKPAETKTLTPPASAPKADAKPAAAPKASVAKPAAQAAPKVSANNAYTRIDAVADALRKAKTFKTIKDWVAASDAEYAENGGKSNLVESATMTKYAWKVLRKYGVEVPAE